MKGKDLKPHIGIFGRRNVGKSSFINAITNSDIAIVSDVPGTTTDPVKKSMEIFGVGPAIIIDTAGIDDEGELGQKRIKKTLETIKQIDCAILLISNNRFGSYEIELINRFKKFNIPFFIVHNKSDLEKISDLLKNELTGKYKDIRIVDFSALNKYNLENVIETLKETIPENIYHTPSLLGGIIERGDLVMLITPIDSEAPEKRMILPQVMTIRDVLDNNAINIVLKETEIEEFFKKYDIKPALVITDSQVFNYVSKVVPKDIPLTSFSILFARLKGPFDKYIEGVKKIDELKDNDLILILESCTHQVNCDDIGRFKIPQWLMNYTGKKLNFEVLSGLSEIQRPINEYKLIIQCGSCMITRKQTINRLIEAIEAGIPVTNYGMTIAYINGIFDRVIAPFQKQVHEKYR